MASLRYLPSVVAAKEEAINENLNWDETIGSNDEKCLPLLCLHASAHGSTVFGKNWSTSFAPHLVCHLASNHEGSIIVTSTNEGNISLLRARDGQVLATRRVSEASSTTKSAQVSFVADAHCHHAKDILIITVPSNRQETNESHSENVRVIIVSNIDGQQLNDENMEAVTQAASKMSIDAIRLATTKDLEALQATFLNATTVRLAVGDCDGNVSIHDYDTLQKQARVVCENVLKEKEPLLPLVGIKLQKCGNDCVFVLFACAHLETSIKLYWYDLIHLNMACEYTLLTKKKKQPWLLDFEPLKSFHDSSLAVAVAMKESSAASTGFIQVLQVCAEDTMGLTVLTRPHKIYQISLEGSTKKSLLQGASLVALEEAGPYAFRFQADFGSERDATCCEFITSNDKIQDGIVGKIRMLIEREMYDEADALLASTNSDILQSDTFAKFHSSEVALRRLERLLSSGDLGPEEIMERAQECLRRLIAGAVSSNEHGLQLFVQAADCVNMWPSGTHQPTLAEFAMALSAVISAIHIVLQSVKPEFFSLLEIKKKELENRLSATKCIEALVETDPARIVLSAPFIEAKSPSEVFLVLMEEGFFSVAEKFWRSEWGRHLNAETSAASILSLSPSYDPRAYAAVLRDIVLPKLSITHEAIPLIRAWACRCANIYDDNDSELGLEASIFLLETVLDGVQQLNLQIHSSYANYSPFLDTKSKKHRHPSPRNAALDNSSSSYSSDSSEKRRLIKSGNNVKDSSENPAPTILELGFLKGGATKSKLQSIASRRSGDAASFIDEDAEDGEESLEIKLRHAQLLERARQLGLPWDVVSLRDYLKLGGTDRVAKELVRIHSSAASGHDERFVALTSRVKPFCDESGVDYDQVLVSYNADLCDSRRTSVGALLESSSIARCCFAPLVKCQVALAVLRVALLCGKAPSCLTELSRDSINWAAIDTTIKSELEEATRLLLVDSIVRKYCGHGARELFRVDNPLHAVRLLDFVTLHFRTKSVLSDLFDLCDAFTFLTREDACVQILQRAAASGDSDLCVDLLSTIFTLGDIIAYRVCRQVISYCCLELEEVCSLLCQTDDSLQYDSIKERAAFACRIGRCIAEAYYERSQEPLDANTLLHPSFRALARDFGRLQRLQEHHNLFLPLTVFDSKQSALKAARSLLDPIVESVAGGNSEDILSLMTNAKAGCAILAGPNGNDCQAMWYIVAGEAASCLASTTNDERCGDFLATAGILDDYGDPDAVRAILSVALSLCRRASDGTASGLEYDDDETLSKMKDVIRASSLVQDYALLGCPKRTLKALVSLGLLTETARQVVVRADEGVGESLEVFSEKLRQEARARRHHSATVHCRLIEGNGIDTLRVSKPLLHPSWYVGDGLLLSPREALSWSVAFCRDLFSFWHQTGASIDCGMDGDVGLHRFLGDRGAHAVALRISSVFSSIALSTKEFPQAFDGAILGDAFVRQQRDTIKSLCERSLGGSGSGITSMTIDSQLAVSFLLSLPIKIAFKVYQASLPTAITKRDFLRVVALANIGVYAGEGKGGWETQKVFVSQCRDLASRARWWDILKFYGVEFDPSRFEANDSFSGKGRGNELLISAYVASLVPQLIRKASDVLQSADLARNVAISFVESFGHDIIIAAQKHVEFMLSPACIRWDLSLCERSACDSLRLIHSPMKRSAVLRRCVTTLENSRECDTDYERHAMVLSLYHTNLSLVVAKDPAIRDMDGSAHEDELELIERRRDALAILSSYFQGEQKTHRPPFPMFFKPLHVPFCVERGNFENPPFDILGVSGDQDHTGSTFDPLQPLHDFLCFHMDETSAKALSPLTIPLGLPHGSLHVKCLVERFRRSKEGQATLPSFEHEVLPVLKRLKRSSDQSRLAECCSEYYDDLDPQKLQCLDHAVQYAMTASSEVEKRLCFKTKSVDASLEADERRALDAVKRLSHKHSSLSDRLEVNGILQTATVGTSHQFSAVEKMVRDLTDRLQESFWKSADSSPEKFVEKLLVEASLLASNACLDQSDSFSISQLRHMASVVHQACKKIAESYSHVLPGDISRSLARRWLVHGDETGNVDARTFNPAEKTTDRSRPEVSVAFPMDDDEIVDFVMDLNDTKSAWSDDIGSILSQNNGKSSTVCQEEEPSTLQPHRSSREASELECTKVSLRVAFVMSFSEGYHKSHGEPNDEENVRFRANLESKTLIIPPKTTNRPGLLSRISTKDASSNSSVMLHARELLRIVFAKSEGTSVDPTVSFLSTRESFASDAPEESRKTLTFAMRYRAIRTVAVLCPQVALDKIIDEEGYLNNNLGGVDCTLKKCTYGAFVAKEIEEMGLPLPHSNLIQLSTMHFPSYARALWRHHHDEAIRGGKGRLLLLLLEMSLRDNTDWELASTLLNEMSKLQLPRTLLLSCECVAEYRLNSSATQPSFFFEKKDNAVSNAVFTVANLVLSEAHRSLSNSDPISHEVDKGLTSTLPRVGDIVKIFSDGETGQRQVTTFVKVLVDLVALDRDPYSKRIAEIALSAIRCISSVEIRRELLALLAQYPGGQVAIRRQGKTTKRDEVSVLLDELHKKEASYRL